MIAPKSPVLSVTGAEIEFGPLQCLRSRKTELFKKDLYKVCAQDRQARVYLKLGEKQ